MFVAVQQRGFELAPEVISDGDPFVRADGEQVSTRQNVTVRTHVHSCAHHLAWNRDFRKHCEQRNVRFNFDGDGCRKDFLNNCRVPVSLSTGAGSHHQRSNKNFKPLHHFPLNGKTCFPVFIQFIIEMHTLKATANCLRVSNCHQCVCWYWNRKPLYRAFKSHSVSTWSYSKTGRGSIRFFLIYPRSLLSWWCSATGLRSPSSEERSSLRQRRTGNPEGCRC